MNLRSLTCVAILGCALAAGVPAWAGEWPGWRGPFQNGVSPETGLVSRWSADGENLVWRADFIGRSTPIVLDGRVCALGRVGEGVGKQEVVACFDAGTGEKRWEHRFNVFHTTVPFSRVGWTHPVGDPETGYIYAHGVGGMLFCFDRNGTVVWSRSLTEEFGRISGYGGRTHSPILDEDRLILSFSNAGWGDQSVPRHRYVAFDKRTGEILWRVTPGGRPRTMTTYSTPVIAVINGRRLLIDGNSDGSIYALKARTGETVWRFELSKLGINTSVVVDGTRVYAAIGQEPVDEAIMGRVVCIDGTGAGDVTTTHEVWRAAGLKAGYASPVIHDGRLYVIDDSANLHALDAATGKSLWEHSLGTVGKGSPVWADGKIYAPEVNGNMHILKPAAEGVTTLDTEHLKVEGTRHAEIYGSPAIAYGRVYFTTEEGLYCLGDRTKPFRVAPGDPAPLPPEAEPADRTAASIQVVPAEVVARPGEAVQFRILTFDVAGRPLEKTGVTWGLDGLKGAIDRRGRFKPDRAHGAQAGHVTAQAGALRATARVRVFPDLPWEEDFETIEPGVNPPYWIGAGRRFVVQEKDGNRVLAKPFIDRGLERQNALIGPPDLDGYTIQTDLMGTRKGRRRPDMGLIAGRYTLDLMGNHQRLQIRDWAELRLEHTVPFPWETDVWYTMKMRVDVENDRALIRGKVWRADRGEPEEWTISVEDPVPNRRGSPGLYGYSPTTIFYDNVKVTVTKP